jgi:hypothetical protein
MLHIDIGGIGVKADIKLSVNNIEEKVDAFPAPGIRVQFDWEAASMPDLFPLMKGRTLHLSTAPTSDKHLASKESRLST